MEKGERQGGSPEQRMGGREPQRAQQPGPGKVTRTSKLSPGGGAPVQRRAAPPGAANPPSPSRQDSTADVWMDAAHRGGTALAEHETGGPATSGQTSGTGVVQMSEPDVNTPLRLQEPELGSSLGAQRPRIDLGVPRLHLDPAIQVMAMDAQIRQLLEPARVQLMLRQLEPPRMSGQPPRWDEMPARPAQPPLVPPGPGPETPRQGTPGDVLAAIMAVPSVRSGLEQLQERASNEARRAWNRSSTSERALMISAAALVAGGAISGVAMSPEARERALQQLAGSSLPVPGLPLTVRIDLAGPDYGVLFTLDVEALLNRIRPQRPPGSARPSRRGDTEPSSSGGESGGP
jgi:hypothetical protein